MVYSSRKKEEEFQGMENEGENVFRSYISEGMSITLDYIWNIKRNECFDSSLINSVLNTLNIHGIDTSNIDIYKPFDQIAKEQDHYLFCDFIEAWILSTEEHAQETLERTINAILHRDRYDKRLLDNRIVPHSESLANQGILNTFSIVCVGEDMKMVRDKMRKALIEYSDSKFGNAVADAAAGLQEFLKVKGFDGHALGNQVHAAKNNGFIQNVDMKIWLWVCDTRNGFSVAHNTPSSKKAQTWSYLQVVGSLMERYSITEELEEQ